MLATILAAFAVATSFCGSAAAQSILLTNATVIDGTGSQPQSNVTIAIEGGRIADMVTPDCAGDPVPSISVALVSAMVCAAVLPPKTVVAISPAKRDARIAMGSSLGEGAWAPVAEGPKPFLQEEQGSLMGALLARALVASLRPAAPSREPTA